VCYEAVLAIDGRRGRRLFGVPRRNLAAGDFNGDGFCDLAVGVFQAEVKGAEIAGAVYVLYGSSSGLGIWWEQRWTQATPGIAGRPETPDYFGAALVAGDFDDSGEDDLAVGVPNEGVRGRESAGAVHIIPGSPGGLTAAGSQYWTEGSPGVPGRRGTANSFGQALASGHFDGTRYAGLAVGMPGQTVNGHSSAGAVVVLSGGPDGLTKRRIQRWTQDSPGIAGTAERMDGFGGSGLVAGRFTGGRYDDLAIGVPEEGVGRAARAGVVQVIYGTSSGLDATGSQLWSEASAGIAFQPVDDAGFGLDLAIADFGRNGPDRSFDDLAIGAPGDGMRTGGVVHVIYGSRAGLAAEQSQFLNQAGTGIQDRVEATDLFGASLVAANFGAGRYADLMIGVPGETVGRQERFIGSVQLVYGSRRGITGRDSAIWSPLDFPMVPEGIDPSLGWIMEAR
jgi:hypothetical protein